MYEEMAVLDGLEAVRRRPTMYVGPLERATTQLVESALCAAVDDAYAGLASKIEVTLHADGSATVSDDGPGMPIGLDPRSGKSGVETLLTVLASCRAARRREDVAKRFCGAGIVTVNALSAWLEVEVRRGGRLHRQRYERARPMGALVDVGESSTTGTTLRFLPDATILPVPAFDRAALEGLMAEIGVEAPGVSVVVRDERRAS